MSYKKDHDWWKKDEKVNKCLKCPNSLYCLVYKKYGGVTSPTECIELTKEMRKTYG